MRVLRTTCTRDCPDACGLLVEIDEAGRPRRLRGDPDHPVTRGFLCYRVGTHYLDRLSSEERLLRPLVRRRGRLVPCAWPEAFARAAEGLDGVRRRHGAAALLHLQGGGSLGLLKQLNVLFSRLLGATETSGDVCDAAGSFACEADFGAADANDPEQIAHAGSVILWGKNPACSSPHTVPFLREAKRRGAPIAIVDPLPQRLEAMADLVLRPRPGGDAALALAVARLLLDEGGIDPSASAEVAENPEEYFALLRTQTVREWAAEADVEEDEVSALARLFQSHVPTTTLIGWGLQRRRNGAAQVRAIDALHVVTGNIGRPGAGPAFTTPRKRPFDLSAVATLADRVPRTIPIWNLAAAITSCDAPPIRGAFVDNMNPVCTNAESGAVRDALAGLDFLLVLDPFLTDTARLADVVLPTSMMLEEEDLVGSYGHHRVSRARRVVSPPGDLPSDLEIYQELARRLDLGDALEGSADEWIERLARPLTEAGLAPEELLRAAPSDPRASTVAFAGGRFATPSGKARLLERLPPPPRSDVDDPDRFPLTLFSISTGRWQTSQLTNADEEREGELEAVLHPEAAPGFHDGEHVFLESPVGRLAVRLRFDARFRRDCVRVPRARSLALGRSVNALVRARRTDDGGGLAYLDQRVRIVPAITAGDDR